MNLVFYVKGFPPAEYGGPVVAAYHLIREFLKDPNLRVTLIVQTDCTEEEIHHSLGAPTDLTILRLRYYPSFHDLRTLLRVARELRKADIVHFNAFPFRHFVYMLLAKLQGIPIVFRVGGFLSGETETTFGPAYPLTVLTPRGRFRFRFPQVFARALLGLYRWVAPLWTAVIMNSEALKQRAVDVENFDTSRIHIIPNGVDLPTRPPRLPVPHDGPPRLLFVGKLEKIKGPDLLFDALGLLGREESVVELSVVGTGSLKKTLQDRAERLRPHRITFQGFCHGRELKRLYEWADIVVVPSRYDSFPLVVLEAMAARRPLVATAVGGIPEILSAPRNALLVDPDVKSIARGGRRLIQDPRLQVAMAEANFQDVHQYSWSAVAQRYLFLYERLVRGAAVPSKGETG